MTSVVILNGTAFFGRVKDLLLVLHSAIYFVPAFAQGTPFLHPLKFS